MWEVVRLLVSGRRFTVKLESGNGGKAVVLREYFRHERGREGERNTRVQISALLIGVTGLGCGLQRGRLTP